MRWWGLVPCVLVACNSGDLLGKPDASVDDASTDDVAIVDDVVVSPDVTVDASVGPGAPDVVVQETSVVDAPPPDTGPPPLWWEQTTNGHPATTIARDSNLNVLVGGGAPFYLEEFDAIGNPIWKKYGYPQTSGTYGSVTAVA